MQTGTQESGESERIDGATREVRVFVSAMERCAKDGGFLAFAGLEGAAGALARAARTVGAPLERLTAYVRGRTRDMAKRQRLSPSVERELAVSALARVVDEYERADAAKPEGGSALWLVLPEEGTAERREPADG